MSEFLKINQKALINLMKFNEELKEKILRVSLAKTLFETRKSVCHLSRKIIVDSKLLNIRKKEFRKRVKYGKGDNMSVISNISNMRSSIYFETYREALSSFKYRKIRVTGKNGRKYWGVTPLVFGHWEAPGKTFLRKSVKGHAAPNSFLSLARKTSKRDSYEKEKLNISISDILRRNTSLIKILELKAHEVYKKRMEYNLGSAINKELKKVGK